MPNSEAWGNQKAHATHRTDLGMENPKFAQVGTRSTRSPQVLLYLTGFYLQLRSSGFREAIGVTGKASKTNKASVIELSAVAMAWFRL